VLLLLAVPTVLSCAYLLLATLLSSRLPAPRRSARILRFDLIVPAHDEAPVIARTVASLRRLDWPPDRFRILVVADNCSDATADIARDAGAQVMERHDQPLRGKGYALRFAFDRSERDRWADAVVVVDADSEASANLLESLAARIEAGAQALQVHYGVLNPQAAWRTRLIAIAIGAFHAVRSRARERLGLSCGIRGNGWCLTQALLQRVPYRAFSLAEDIEYGIELGFSGCRVHYCDEAQVLGEMVTGARAAGRQRQRWESGRLQLVRSRTLPLLRAALHQRSRICLDLAFDLALLPLSYVALMVALLALLAGLDSLRQHQWLAPLWVACGCALTLALYVLRGWQLSRVGWRGLLALLGAPVFVLWKLALLLGGRRTSDWVRTERERP
jgi:cellulose synthase/poly-beta-1,6-N-acetylglucosamine synthase-like glycosyltransferase